MATHREYWNSDPVHGASDSAFLTIKSLGYDVAMVSYPLRANMLLHFCNAIRLLVHLARTRPHVAIGADPINAYIVTLAKRLGLVRRAVYYFVDFAVRRFENPILNALYEFLDRRALNDSDSVWGVSTRALRYRVEVQNTPREKLVLVPNNAFNASSGVARNRCRGKFVIVSSMNGTFEWAETLQAFYALVQRYPHARLIIVGDGPERTKIEEEICAAGLKDVTTFKGLLDYSAMLAVVKGADVGLAIYNSKNPWTVFGDSMKAREAMSQGLPVIISNNASTADDVQEYGSGIAVDPLRSQVMDAMMALCENRELYARMSSAALQISNEQSMRTALAPVLACLSK